MKLSNGDLKKALQKASIPQPAEDAKKLALQRAADEFAAKSPDAEKKSKGILPIFRHMGKGVARFLTIKGEPIMTRTSFATIGVAVIVAGVFLTIGTNMHFSPVQQDLAHNNKPEQAALPPVENERIAAGAQTAALPETEAGGPPLTLGKGQQTPELDAAIPQEPVQNHAVKSKDEQLAATSGQKTYQQYEPGKSSQIYKVPGYAPGESGYAAPAPILREGSVAKAPAADAISYYYKDVGRDRFTEITANPVNLVAEQPVSTFSIDVDTASYGFVRRQLHSGVLPQKNAVRIEEMINYFDYDYALPRDRSRPFAPTVAVYPAPWNSTTKILHVGIKGYDIQPAAKPVSNLVFLVDVSGSMNSPDKLPLLKNSLALLVDRLGPDDTVAIVVYAGAAGTVLEPTRIREKSKILAALDRLQAGGSTAGGAGVNLAYSLAEMNFNREAVNRVILATDGDFNVGITDQAELKSYIERKRKTGIYLSVLGFGQGNYNDALMQTLAQNGNGTAAYIDTLSEARKVLVDEADSTLFTIARDVKIQVEFNPAQVHDYRLIGYETRMLNREDFNNDQVDAGDVGAGASVTALYEITLAAAREKLVDPLRYQAQISADKAEAPSSAECAFLKIRYKLPDSDESTLITRSVAAEQEYGAVNSVPQDMRFAASVAAFGQILRQDPYTGNFSYDDVIALAEGARGRDPFGLRAEFVNLVRLAKSARGM
jgi:Ca-activated chloride channel family protein